MGQAVVFRGISDVVSAYKAGRVAPWAILCGKTILQSSEDVEGDDVESGAQQLQEYLKLMKRGGTEGKYILQTYKLKEGEEIDSKTAVFRGFPFSLWEIEGEGSFSSRAGYGSKATEERLDRLEALIVSMHDQEEEKESGGIGSVVNGVLMHPELQKAIALGAVGLVSKMFPMQQQQQPAKIAGVSGSEAKQSLLNDEQMNKAQTAINILCGLDANLGDNLMKVAKVAQENPQMYSMFVTKML